MWKALLRHVHAAAANCNGAKRLSSTVDSVEASKFILTASEWWDTAGAQQPLHAMNTIRVPLVKRALLGGGAEIRKNHTHPLEGLTVLDVGCGGGILSEPLARLGASVTGIDVTESSISAAKHHAECDPGMAARLTYLCTSVEELVARDAENQFDCVVASEVLEHVANVPLFVGHLCQLIRPGGALVLSTINRTPSSLVLAVGVAEYVMRIVPRGTHDWNRFLTPMEVTSMLADHGLQVVLSTGMAYNPFTVTWSLMQDKSTNYLLHAVKRN